MAHSHEDNHLLQALVDGDRAGIEEIYRRSARRCRAMVEANSGNAADAEDLFQDVLIEVAAQARGGFVLTCPIDAFLALVCRRRWLNELRSRQRQGVTKSRADGFDAEIASPAASELAELFEAEAVRRALASQAFEKLGEGCRELLELAWSGDFSMIEVAEKLGFTYGYARKKKHECLQKLADIAHKLPGFDAAEGA